MNKNMIENMQPGDIIEYMNPYDRMGKKIGADDARYGVGRLVSIDENGGLSLKNNLGDKWKIHEHWVRKDRTEYHKNIVVKL